MLTRARNRMCEARAGSSSKLVAGERTRPSRCEVPFELFQYGAASLGGGHCHMDGADSDRFPCARDLAAVGFEALYVACSNAIDSTSYDGRIKDENCIQ